MHQTWSFVATEIDQRSFESACKNVEMNGLSGRITILKIDDQRANLLPHLSEVKPHLVMCNPPFYDPEEEQVKKAIKRARINYTNGEGFYPGGEVAFVKRMIEESLLRPEVFFFSAIIGIKRHLMVLEEYLRMIEEKSVVKIFSSLVGRTRRWILAWSFNPSVIKRMRSKRAFFDVSDLKELGIVSDDGIVYHVKKVNWTRKSRRMKKVEDMQECDFKFTLEEAPKLLCEETVENQILFNSLINHLNNKKRGTI